MGSDFTQGMIWTCLLLGLWNYVIRPNVKPVHLIKLVQILIETLQNSKKGVQIKKEGHMIKIEGDNELYLPIFSTPHILDVVCFQDQEHRIKIPFTFFQYKNDYAYIPFKPKDISLTKIYVAIKFMTQDSYLNFEIQENEFFDIPKLLEKYQEELSSLPEQDLAEAYD